MKRYNNNIESYDKIKEYTVIDAVDLLHNFKRPKFDESIDLSISLGVDPKHADQIVRGTVIMPNGTGKNVKVVVITKDDEKIKEAQDLGALEAGHEDLLKKINKGWLDFDVMIATPDMMAEVGKLGRVLGPRGLMPNPKIGTVTNDVSKAVNEVMAGKVEFRVDKDGNIGVSVGKLSFEKKKLTENIITCMNAILKAKPAAVKGIYFKKLIISSTMSPGIKIDKSEFLS